VEATCWSGLKELDAKLTLDTLGDALRQVLASEDPLLHAYLTDRLAELVGDDVAKGEQLLEWSKTATDAESGVLLGALSKSAAGKNPRLAGKLLDLAEDSKVSPATQLAAMEALGAQKSLDVAHQDRLKKLALNGPSDDAAWTATRTLGTVMNESFKSGGDFKPYWDRLLDVAESSVDPSVRQLALEMPTYTDAILQKDSLPRLATLLSDEAEKDLREQAAFRLSLTEAPDEALKIYESAFANEYDECVRWAIFRFAFRAGGPSAFPVLERMAALDARFLPDLREFKTLVAQGHLDFERLHLNLSEEHHCLTREEGSHGD